MPDDGDSWASKIERQHHEVATAGQAEIDYRFDTLVRAADAMMVYKYVVKNVARRHGKTAMLHAQTALWRQWLGHAHPPSRSGRRASRSLPATNTPGSRRWPSITSAGLLKHAARAVRDLQSDDQQLQASGARLRSAGQPGLLARATAPPRSAFRPTARVPRPSASSIVRPIRRPIRIWPLRRC